MALSWRQLSAVWIHWPSCFLWFHLDPMYCCDGKVIKGYYKQNKLQWFSLGHHPFFTLIIFSFSRLLQFLQYDLKMNHNISWKKVLISCLLRCNVYLFGYKKTSQVLVIKHVFKISHWIWYFKTMYFKKKMSLISGNKLPVFVVLFKWMITNAQTNKKFNLRNPNTNDPKMQIELNIFLNCLLACQLRIKRPRQEEWLNSWNCANQASSFNWFVISFCCKCQCRSLPNISG